MSLKRREVLMLALIGATAEAADFWKDKKPPDWSDKDIERLFTRSPWAKEATVAFSMAGMDGGGMRGGGPPGGGSPPGGGMGGPPGGGMGGPSGGGGMGAPPGGGSGGPGGMPELHAVVRWESAAPLRAARKNEAAMDGRYVLSVSGLPMAARRNSNGGNGPDPSEMLKRLATMTDIERKGKDSVPCSHVELSKGDDTNSILFYFDPGSSPIRPEDKEVTFNTKIGPLQVKAKFVLKEMIFEGKLAV